MSYARGEVGAMLAPGLSSFAFGEGTLDAAGPAWATGLGMRYRW